MTDHACLILLVLFLFGVILTSRRWTKVRPRRLQQRLSTIFVEWDQVLLLGGLLLSVLSSGLLVLYLLLQP